MTAASTPAPGNTPAPARTRPSIGVRACSPEMALRFAILGLLAEQPQTGYQLAKRFDGSVAFFWQAKFQQIYAELRRLEAEGLASAETVPQRGRPTKRLHSITLAGEAALDRWLAGPTNPMPVRDEHLVKVFSITRLPADRAIALVEQERERHHKRLETYEAMGRLRDTGAVTSTDVDDALLGPYLTLLRGIGYERETLRWCDRALAVLRRRAARHGGA